MSMHRADDGDAAAAHERQAAAGHAQVDAVGIAGGTTATGVGRGATNRAA